MNLTITGNTIADPGEFGTWGLNGVAGAESGDSGLVCADIANNSLTNSAQPGQGGADIELDQQFSSTIELPGYTGSASAINSVESLLNTSNGATPSVIATISGSGGGFTGGASCPTP